MEVKWKELINIITFGISMEYMKLKIEEFKRTNTRMPNTIFWKMPFQDS